MPKIVALTGFKGSGKDTVADILIQQYKERVDIERIAFADPIKHEVMRVFGLRSIEDYDVFKRSLVTSNNHSFDGRHIVREIGMLMRRYDVNQFVQYVDDTINSKQDTIWIITDMRFDNELIHLQNLGAKIVKINRPFVGSIIDTHITERGFDDSVCDVVIENRNTLEEFTSDVLKVFEDKFLEWKWL